MKRKRVTSNATSRKVPRSNEPITTDNVDVRLEGHKSVLFYVFVQQRQHKRQVFLSYLDPPVHEESLLANEHMSSEYFTLQSNVHDTHLLSHAEKDMCID